MPLLTYILYYFLKHKTINADLLAYKRQLEVINKEINDQLNNCNREILKFVRNKDVFNNNTTVVNNSLQQLEYIIKKLNSALHSASTQMSIMHDKYLQEEKNSQNYFKREIKEFNLKVWEGTYLKILSQLKKHEDMFQMWEKELPLANPNTVQPLILTHNDLNDDHLKVYKDLSPIWDKIVVYDLNPKPILDNFDILSRELDHLEKYITM